VIVTVTLNPALQVRYAAQRVALGGANPVSQVSYRARGAGLAVARVLHTFGHEVVAAGLAGGAAGELIRAELSRSGVATQFTRIAMESRRVMHVTDASTGEVTTFGEPAPYITTEELGRLATDYRALMDGATAVVLCGTLPAGLPPEIYASLASYAAEAGVPAVLDARGSALRHAVTRRPALAVPGPPPDQVPDELVALGAEAVVEASGGIVRVVTAAGQWRAWLPAGRPPAESAGRLNGPPPAGSSLAGSSLAGSSPAGSSPAGPSPAGPSPAGSSPAGSSPAGPPPAGCESGPGWPHDALVAGFVPGIALGWSWADMLAHAVALAAAVRPPGDVDLSRYEALLPEVQVEPPAG
jgi:fructose-1-phosphate kinase PfkB-like protein